MKPARQALEDWQAGMARLVNGPVGDMTARQLAILLNIYLAEPPHTVRSLSQSLNISKAATTRALDRLERGNLIRRRENPEDRRSMHIQRTVTGSVFVSDLGEVLAQQ